MSGKKVISLIIVLVIIVAVAGVLWTWKGEAPGPGPGPSPGPEEEVEEKLKMGMGYSKTEDPEQAIQEAHDRMMEKLGDEDPIFVILTSTVGYDQEKVLSKLNEIMPEVKVYGYTSLMGIMSKDGFHIGEGVSEGQVLSLMGFATDQIEFGIGAASLDEVSSPEEAGAMAIDRAVEDAGKIEGEKPKVVLMSTSPFGIGEEQVILGVEGVLGKDVPIVGGGAAAGYSDLSSGGEVLFANDEVYPKGVVVAPIYTDLKIGHAFLSGFDPTGQKGTVTDFRVEEGEYQIVEIDDKPAAEVYNNWLDGLFDEYLGTSEMFLGEAVNHTFGKKVIESGGYTNWQMIVPFHFNPDDSITVGATAQRGTELHLLESNPQLFKKRASLAVELAQSRGGITDKEIAGVILDQCGGTLLGIPEGVSGWNDMVSQINSAAGGAPFLGVSNLGPYGHFLGVGNRYGEVTTSVLIFGKE